MQVGAVDDVVVGAMLGQSIGRMVVNRAREADEERGYRFATYVPETDPGDEEAYLRSIVDAAEL